MQTRSGFSVLRVVDKLLVIVKRDCRTALRQRRSFAGVGLMVLFEVSGLYFLARAIGPEFRPEGGSYFPFAVVGVAALNFLFAGIDGFISAIHDAQIGGTIEAMMNTATPPVTVVMLSAISSFLSRILRMILYVGIALMMMPLPTSRPNYLGCLVILVLSIVCASSFGVFAAAVQVWNQRGRMLVWLSVSIAWLLSGTMFPVVALPPILRRIADWLPFTHSLNGLRLALLQGSGMRPLWTPMLTLLAFSMVLFPLSCWAFSLAIRNARRRGTLSFY
jgi:ABC-2 type transport system permease protein